MAIDNDLLQIAQAMGMGGAYQQRIQAGMDYKQAMQNKPTISQIRQGLADSPVMQNINRLQEYEANAAKQLFEEPTKYLTEMSKPGTAGFVANPMARLGAASDRWGILAKNLTNIKNEIIRKEGDLDDIIKAYSDEYDYVLQNKLLEKQEADTLFDMAFKIAQESYDRKQVGSSGGTQTERFRNDAINSLAKDVQSGMTLEQAMGKYGDELGYRDIVDTYDDKSSWGEAKESEEEKQSLYQRIVRQGGGTAVPEISTAGERKDVGNYVALLKDAQNVLNRLKGGDENVTYLESLGRTTTGPLGALLGGAGAEGGVRVDVDRLRSNIEREFYGVAISKQEAKKGKWIPKTSSQESVNITKLKSLNRVKTQELISKFRAMGWKDDQIMRYFDANGISYIVEE